VGKVEYKMHTAWPEKLVIKRSSIRPEHIPFIGSKAIGLSNLPQSWVPDFFIITNSLIKKWSSCYSEKKDTIVKCQQVLTDGEIQLIAKALKSLGIQDGERIIVRSSSAQEGIELRGTFISKVSEGTPEAILASCDVIYQQASSEYVKKYVDSLSLAVIVQKYIEPRASGHLSNERRVARRRQEWLYEFEGGQGSRPIGRFALKYGRKRSNRATTEELDASNQKELIRQLRSVAAYIDNEGLRLHMEWVWDGKRLWIAQGDKDPEIRGPNPTSYLSAMRSSQGGVTLRSFIPANSVSHNRWNKLQCMKDFQGIGLPTANLWVLEDTSILTSLQSGIITEELKQDIDILVANPIVIRMDIASYGDLLPEMLPRSDCLTTARSAEEFFIRESSNMLSRGIGSDDFCFIAHQYIPSRSSAFCLAFPHRSRVRVDSIWGLPDGLLFYPHDSFELNPNDIYSLKKRIRFKDNYLATATHGEWIPVRAGRPWDWSASLKKEELVTIGKASQRLADYINDCVQVMWFVGIPSNLGLPSVLPWWYKRGEPPVGVYESDPRVFRRNRILISTKDDLGKISVNQGGIPEGTTIRLTPQPELLRDVEFLKAVANKSLESNIPVELQGSILQHAYYQLKQLGVSVQSVDFFTPAFQAQIFGKLVRDLIPLRIRKGGERMYTIKLTGEDMIEVLKAKAVEEALELQSTTNVNDIKEELGDIWEVILSLAERISLPIGELNQMVELKRKERGGFREGILLIETSEVPLIDIDRSVYQATRQEEQSRLPLPNTGDGVATITSRRIPRYYQGKIAIPLVPSDIRQSALKVEELGIVLKIRYEDKEIILSWGRETPHVPREQLRLFE
jgi:predicted house-cleaning noncanonical NTP pyrophosphatase (MazG superfamily)